MPSSTDAARDVRVPRETVNDDVVTVQSWSVAHGQQVARGDVVVDIETSKAVIEVEAECDGYLHHLHGAGAEVPVGELVGRVEEAPPSAAQVASDAPSSDGEAVTISHKARALIDANGIDPSVFAGRGLIRERDVRSWMDTHESTADEPVVDAPEWAPREPSSAHRAPAEYRTRGLMGDARASASDRGSGLTGLILNYVWRNWLLGNLVKVAPRGVINVLHRWRGVKMGRDCFIDPTAILETAYPENITMGNDVRVTVGCIIMTHIKAPHHLRETGIMPAVLSPVVLEDACFIGVNSVVMPGVTVGQGAVVASGSVVVTNVPPYTMVSGNPAKVVKEFPDPGEDALA